MTPTLADYVINISYTEPHGTKTFLLKDGGHQEAVRLAIDTVKKLREQGIMDAIEILPRDDGNGAVYSVVQVSK
jgi:hypothetical protein